MESAAELYSCPVRRRYLWQLMRYGRPTARWRRRLHEGARGGVARAGEIAALLRIAQEHTGHYADVFASAGVQWRDLRGAGDLAHFPALTRAALQERYYDVFHRGTRTHDVEEGWLGRTSGSTGEPVRFFMDAESIHFFTAFIRFLWERLSCGPLPFPGSAGIVLLCTLPRSSVYRVRLPLFRGTLFRKMHFEEPGMQADLERLNPALFTGDPDSLARLCDAIDGGLKVSPRLVLSSAFPLGDPLAERLRRATGAKVVDYWSMAETGPLAWKCESGIFHVVEGAVEIEEDAGELLVTNLRNALFPLIRYRTGDLGQVGEAGACPCGASTRTIEAFSGRTESRFRARDGAIVDPSKLSAVLSALDVRQFRLVQTAADQVRLEYWGDREVSTGTVERAMSVLLRGPSRVLGDRSPTPIFAPGEKPVLFLRQVA